MDKLTAVVSVVSGSEIPARETTESESVCPSLSWRQRLTGCACCCGLGMLFSLLSFVAILQVDLVFFSVLFTMGNVASLGGMLFLAGPMSHLKRMFDEGRWIATTVYILSIVLTLIAALVLRNALLVLLFCIIQTLAMAWYVLSYIPFARDAVKACFGRLLR